MSRLRSDFLLPTWLSDIPSIDTAIRPERTRRLVFPPWVTMNAIEPAPASIGRNPISRPIAPAAVTSGSSGGDSNSSSPLGSGGGGRRWLRR